MSINAGLARRECGVVRFLVGVGSLARQPMLERMALGVENVTEALEFERRLLNLEGRASFMRIRMRPSGLLAAIRNAPWRCNWFPAAF